MKSTLKFIVSLWALLFTVTIAPTPLFALAPKASIPVHLKIPALNIDTAIQSVGKDKTGNMDVPNNSTDVAWYNLGTVPGDPGNAVISGHYDDKKGPAIFYKLGKLKKGDSITVTDNNGLDRVFKVIEVASYPYNKAPLNKIFGFDLNHDLNLITCDGRWNSRTHTYNQRLVVYARMFE